MRSNGEWLPIIYGGLECLHLQPFQTAAEAPTEFWRIVLYIDLIADSNYVKAKGLLPMDHCNSRNRHNRYYMPLTNDPCRWRDRRSVRNDFWRKLVKEIRICKVGRGALVWLCVVKLDSPGLVEHFVRNWSRSGGSTNFPVWQCPPSQRTKKQLDN